MQKLVKCIYDCVMSAKEIPEDLLYEFSQTTIKIVQSGNVQELPEKFEDLQNYVEMFWRGKKYEREKNPARIFQLGQLLSYFNLIRDAADDQKNRKLMEDYIRRWNRKFRIFWGMHDQPGIMHKKLAAFSGISPSELSQFITKTMWDGYYTYRITGREKYYYLTPRGEELFALFQKKREKEYSYQYWGMSKEDLNNEIAGPNNNNIYKLKLIESRGGLKMRALPVNEEQLPMEGYKKEKYYGRETYTIGGCEGKDSRYIKKGIRRKTGSGV